MPQNLSRIICYFIKVQLRKSSDKEKSSIWRQFETERSSEIDSSLENYQSSDTFSSFACNFLPAEEEYRIVEMVLSDRNLWNNRWNL